MERDNDLRYAIDYKLLFVCVLRNSQMDFELKCFSSKFDLYVI